MPNARVFLLSVSASSATVLAGGVASGQVQTPPSSGDRVLGLDVSAWQGNIAQATWNNIRNVEDRQFVFIRSSRGGTTGYYDQTDADNSNGLNTLSQRYDDPYFVQNINRATTAGMLAGPYHFGRMDIIATTKNANGIANTGTDEANHFLEMAGSWMRPGYLLPVFDLEAGISERTPNQLAQFAIDFSNRIYAVKGVRPIVYIGGNYASDIANATAPLPTEVVNAFPNLWSARWPNQADPNSIPVQTANPGDSISTVYGHWDNVQGAHPWKVWQYASTGRLQSFNNGNSNLDFDVAHGNIEYVKDMQVPALWTSTGNGQWSTLTNWNSGQPAVPPVYGAGQVPPVGTQTLPAARLPGAEDNVDLERPNENVTVTLSTAANGGSTSTSG